MDLKFIIISIIATGVLGVVLGVVIGIVARVFAVEVDERIEQVEELLPGANCGGCGFAGCAAFAKAVVDQDAAPGQCPVWAGGEEGGSGSLQRQCRQHGAHAV